MSYEKQTWATGDVISANKLNHMEDGITSGGAFYVTFNGDNPATTEGEFTNVTADHTLEEAVAAYNAGQPVIFRMGGETNGETWTWGDALAYDDGGFLKANIVDVNGTGETSIHIQAQTYTLAEDGPEMQVLSRTIETL